MNHWAVYIVSHEPAKCEQGFQFVVFQSHRLIAHGPFALNSVLTFVGS